ncbi:MAG: hypothetical protein PHT33_15975, partial [bacterium]|nr:hypothetical protein [bacterium]
MATLLAAGGMNAAAVEDSQTMSQTLTNKADNIVKALKTPEAQYLDQLIMNGLPNAAGEFIGALQAATVKQFGEDAWRGGQLAKDLGTACKIGDWTNKLSTAVNRAMGLFDAGFKLSTGQNKEAAVSGVTFLLGELPNLPYGSALMKATRLTTPVLSAAIAGFVTWRESVKKLEEASKGTGSESMLGAIESMCRAGAGSGRKLGEGDPVPVTPENLEKVWNRILTDGTFRGQFANYVRDDLGKEFPEPGWFDTVNEYLYGTVTGMDAEKRLSEETVKKLQATKEEFLPYIAGLLSYLNKGAKSDEQAVLALQEVRKIIDQLGEGGMTLDQAIARVQQATTLLGVVTVYADKCETEINKAIMDKDYAMLWVHKKMISDYVRDVIAWIPAGGPFAAERNADLAKLKSGYALACKAIDDVKTEMAKKVQSPEIPAEYKDVQVSLSPQALYRQYLFPHIKPFDWDGSGGPEAVKSNFKAMLASKNRLALVAIIRAWQKGDYAAAVSDTSMATAESLSQSSYNQSLDKYRASLLLAGIPVPSEVTDYRPAEEGNKAWTIATAIYGDAVRMQLSLIEQEQAETNEWLNRGLGEYDKLLQEMQNRAYEISISLPWIFPLKQTEGYSAIAAVESWGGYGGIPPLDQPTQLYGRGAFDISQRSIHVTHAVAAARFDANSMLEALNSKTQATIRQWEEGSRQWDTVMADARPDIETIRQYIDEDFLNDDDFNKRLKERESVSKYISEMQGKR